MPSKFKIEIRADLRDPAGRLIKLFPWVKANSLLKQFVQILAVSLNYANQTIKDTGGTDRVVDPYASNFNAAAAVGVTASGMLIGTGTTPVTMTDNKIQTQLITNVAHGPQTLAVENPDASTWRIALARTFTNNTGATVSITEVAIYCYASSSAKIFAVDHTLYSVDVPSGVGVTFTYRITVSL